MYSYNVPAEILRVFSISEKVNGTGALALGCEMMTQSSTCPALSETFTTVRSNPTTTSEIGYCM